MLRDLVDGTASPAIAPAIPETAARLLCCPPEVCDITLTLGAINRLGCTKAGCADAEETEGIPSELTEVVGRRTVAIKRSFLVGFAAALFSFCFCCEISCKIKTDQI